MNTTTTNPNTTPWCPACHLLDPWHGVLAEPGQPERYTCDACGHTETIDDSWRAAYGCPTWCTRNRFDHESEELNFPNDKPCHYGPTFGPFVTNYSESEGVVSASTTDHLEDLTPAALRQVAADALAAADWLEGVR